MTSTAPWSTPAEALTSSGFVHVSRLTLVVAGGARHDLAFTAAVVTVDAGRSPRWSLTAAVAFPPAEVRGLMDPRNGLEVDVVAGYRLGTVDDLQALCRLNVTTVVTDHVAQRITITAKGDEDVVIGFAADETYSYGAGSSVVAAIQEVIGDCFDAALNWNTADVGGTPTFDAGQILEVGEDRWDAIVDWAEGAGAGYKVWHDGADTWHVSRPPQVPGSSAAARFTVGPRGNVSSLEVTESRDRWANCAAVVWEHKSTASPVTTTAAVASTGLRPPRMAVIRRKRKPDKPKQTAERALARAQRRGHTVRLRAPAMLWLRPTDTVTLVLPDAVHDRVLVESVAFDLAAGTMTVTGQNPNDSPQAVATSTVTVTGGGTPGGIIGTGGVVLPAGSFTTGTLGINATQGYFTPIFIERDVTMTELKANFSTAGTRTCAIGIWRANPTTGIPGTLIADLTITPASGWAGATGQSVALSAGWYWFGLGIRGVAGTASTVRTKDTGESPAVFTAYNTRSLYANTSEFQAPLISNPVTLESALQSPMFLITCS